MYASFQTTRLTHRWIVLEKQAWRGFPYIDAALNYGARTLRGPSHRRAANHFVSTFCT